MLGAGQVLGARKDGPAPAGESLGLSGGREAVLM